MIINNNKIMNYLLIYSVPTRLEKSDLKNTKYPPLFTEISR